MAAEETAPVIPRDGGRHAKGRKAKPSLMTPFRDAVGMDLAMVIIGALCSAGGGVMLPYFFRSMGKTIDDMNSTLEVDGTVTQMVIAGAACLVLQAVSCLCMEIVADRLTARMRCRFVAAVLSQSMGWYDTHDSASLSSRLDARLTDVRDGIGMKLVAVPANIVTVIGAMVIAFTSCWSITLCSITGFIPTLFFGGVLGWSMRTASRRVNGALEEAGGVATETFTNIRTVAAFGGEKVARDRYNRLITKAERAGIVCGAYSGVGMGGLITSVFLMFALVFYLGGRKAADSMEELMSQLPEGEAAFSGPPSEWPRPAFQGGSAFVISMCMLISSLMVGGVTENVSLFMKAVESAADIYAVIDEPSSINPTSSEGEKDVPLNGDLVFDSVTFSYPSRPDAAVFKNFSLRIPAGKSVAFVGASGCGKSTLLQLTQRIYDPLEGSVFIAGKNLKDLNTRWYRSRLGVVMQEPRLFSVSIEENIRLGCSTPTTTAEVEKVAQQAHVTAFVEQLPQRYQTMCGAGGAQLSGGQKQRVALARALLRKPDVLILDEATSALDSKSERKVQAALDEVIQTSKSTTLIVAHRLSTIQNVDEIIVLDNRGDGAEVVQRGTHQELMQNTQGLYYHLFQSQAGFADENDGNKQQNGAGASSGNAADEATTTGAVPYASVAAAAAATATADDDDDVVMHEPSEVKNASVMDVLESAVGMKTTSLIAKLTGMSLPLTKKNAATLSRAVKMLAPDWFVFAVMVVCSGISGACFPLLGLLLGDFIPVLFTPDVKKLRHDTNFWSLLLLIYCILRFPIEILKQASKEYLGSRLSRTLRERVFENVVYQDMSFFDDSANSAGAIVSTLTEDVAVLTTAATGNFVSLFHSFACVVVGLAIGFANCWRLALVLLATFVLTVVCVSLNSKAGGHSFNAAGGGSKKKKKEDSASGIFAEAVQGIRVVMSFGLEEHFGTSYEKAVTSELGKKTLDAIAFGVSWGISQSMQFFIFALALWYGGKLTKDGLATATEVMNTVFPVIMAASGMGIAVVYSTDAKKAKRAVVEVFRLMDNKSLIDVREAGCGQALLEDFSGSVSYDHVSFRYPLRPDQRVYKDLTFTIAPGESVALVGASGCGKSTAVQLLLRFYDLHSNRKHVSVDGKAPPESNQGCISADQTDIQDVDLTHLRSLIGLVSQEPVLFNLTIAENIRYSKPNATQAEIEEAARLANAHGFISALPDGYDTSAGTAGAQLSGGQRQRIAIARALLRNPKILILDEATSALDAESEKQVQATLDQVVGGVKRSTIIIAHRLSTVRTADKIVVLQNDGGGSLVAEVGTHTQLMNIQDGIYRGLVICTTEGA